MGSPRFSLDRDDAKKILKAFLYSCASAGTVAALALLASVKIPPEYAYLAPLVPFVNALLVAVKKFIDDHTAT